MASVNQLPSGKWRARIHRKLIGHHEKLFDSEEEAAQWASKTEAELLAKVLSKPLGDRSKAGLTFKEAYELYITSLAYLEKSENTQLREKSSSQAVLADLGNETLDLIDFQRVQLYIDKRFLAKSKRGGRISGDTIRLEKALISAVFKYAKRRGLVKYNPADSDLEMPKTRRRECRLSPKQEVEMIQAADIITYMRPRANKCFYPWLLFVSGTGMRPGEASKIRCEWVDLERGEISIPRVSHKTRRPRVILITEELRQTVEDQLKKAEIIGSPYLFWSKSWKKSAFIPYQYSTPWKRLKKAADLPEDFVPHGLRHEFISRLFENTELSDSQVAALVGDVHVLSLEPYKHLRVTSLRPKIQDHSEALEASRDKIALDKIKEINSRQYHVDEDGSIVRATDIPEGAIVIYDSPRYTLEEAQKLSDEIIRNLKK